MLWCCGSGLLDFKVSYSAARRRVPPARQIRRRQAVAEKARRRRRLPATSTLDMLLPAGPTYASLPDRE